MWPTARAEDSESCGNHPGTTDSLMGATRNWATPNAHDGRRPGSNDTSTQGANLKREAELWATPQSHDQRGPKTAEQIAAMREKNGSGVRNLNEDVAHWQTPGTDSFRSRGGDQKDEMGLDQEARTWQTPSARDWKSETGSENNSYDKTPNLSRQVYRMDKWPTPQETMAEGGFPRTTAATYNGMLRGNALLHATEIFNSRLSPPVPVIPDGPQSSEKGPISRRLSPRFVEWLMGFPIGWTER